MSKTTTKKQKQDVQEARDVTATQIANALNMKAKSLRRKLRAETRDENSEHMHKVITRKTRYAFTRSEADAIIARFSASSSDAVNE